MYVFMYVCMYNSNQSEKDLFQSEFERGEHSGRVIVWQEERKGRNYMVIL